MRILQLHNTYLEPGGEDGAAARERSLLEARGHTVEQLSFKNPDLGKEQVVQLVQASWNRNSAARTRDAMSEGRFDVVHIHNTWYQASPSSIVEAARNAPVVATLHNYRRACLNAYLYRDDAICTDCVGSLPWRGVVRGCYRDSNLASAAIGLHHVVNRLTGNVDRSIERFLVLSDFAADIATKTGVEREKIVRHDNFVPDPGRRLEDASSRSVVLALGRLSREKGFLELVKAWKGSAPEGLTLRVVGDGPLRSEIEALAGEGVEVVGRLDSAEVAEQMLSCRALLFPSRWFEGQPLVILESLAAGLPVLSTDHPPLREVLGTCGQYLVDGEDWAAAFRVVADDEWVAEASVAARMCFEERYAPDVAAKRLEAIYESVVDRS